MPSLSSGPRIPIFTDVDQYGRAVSRHWVNLAAGGLMVVLGFVSAGTGFVIPEWVWWGLALIFLTIAQFRAYRDVKRDVEGLKTSEDDREKRRLRLVHDRVLTGERGFIWEFFEIPGKPVTENREFTDCTFYGPAIVTFIVGLDMQQSTLFTLMSPDETVESFLYEMPRRSVQGVFGFVDCTFLRCRFRQIGFIGDKAMLDKMREVQGV